MLVDLRQRLLHWHTTAEAAATKDEESPDWEPPNDLETAWRAWTLLRATGWKHLLIQGGLLDQPEAIMNDVAKIEAVSTVIENQLRDERGQ